MEDTSNVHPTESASGPWPGTATPPPEPSSRTPSTTFMPIGASTGEQRDQYTSIPRKNLNVGTPLLATGQGGARWLSQQPTEPFYGAPDSRASPFPSSPSTAEYSLPGAFPQTHGCSGFAPSVAHLSDSMLVERGSPPSTFSSNNMLAATSSPARDLKTTRVDDDVIHGRKNDKENPGYIPDYDRYRSHRSSEPPDLSSAHPLSGPPYPSQLDEADLRIPRSTHADGSESRNTRRQQPPGTLPFASTSREGDMVENGFLLLSLADADEDWVKVRRPKGHF